VPAASVTAAEHVSVRGYRRISIGSGRGAQCRTRSDVWGRIHRTSACGSATASVWLQGGWNSTALSMEAAPGSEAVNARVPIGRQFLRERPVPVTIVPRPALLGRAQVTLRIRTPGERAMVNSPQLRLAGALLMATMAGGGAAHTLAGCAADTPARSAPMTGCERESAAV
jgi:hypothetical protein